MKKTLTANISGTVFHIEEDAYEKLNRYLDSIRTQFGGSESRDEIMADIEARISELFTQRLQARQVVSIDDVEHVIGVMGQPEEYLGDEPGTGEAGAGGERSTSYAGGPRSGYKRLFRDTEDKWVGGVLSGVAHYFGIDPLVLRLVYIILLFIGVGWLIYIILWIVVPPAETASEKLEMRGTPVTSENIKKMFDEGTERVRKGAKTVADEARDLGRQWKPQDMKQHTDRMAGAVSRGVHAAFTLFGKLVGVVLLLLGSLLALVLIIALVGRTDLVFTSNDICDSTSLHDLAQLLFITPEQADMVWVMGVLCLLMPVVGLIYSGIRLLFDVPRQRWIGWVTTPIWLGAVIVLAVIGTKMARENRRQGGMQQEMALVQPKNGILYLDALTGDKGLCIDGGRVYIGENGIDVRQSPDSLFHLVMEKEAHGPTHDRARERASRIDVNYTQDDSLVRFSPDYSFPVDDKFRFQYVLCIVQVPVGGSVHFKRDIEYLLHNVKNTTDTDDRDMTGRTWTMTPEGLEAKGTRAPWTDRSEVKPARQWKIHLREAADDGDRVSTELFDDRATDHLLPNIFNLLTAVR